MTIQESGICIEGPGTRYAEESEKEQHDESDSPAGQHIILRGLCRDPIAVYGHPEDSNPKKTQDDDR
jgi:hypothetical protein